MTNQPPATVFDRVPPPRAKKPLATSGILYSETRRPIHVSPQERRETLGQFARMAVHTINTHLKSIGIKRQFGVHNGTINAVNAKYAIQHLAERMIVHQNIIVAGGEVSGFSLFPDTIKYACRLAKAMLMRDKNGVPINVTLEAETQFGKTIILIMANILYTMLLDKPNLESIVLVNPSRNAPHQQTDADWVSAMELHSPLYVKEKGRQPADFTLNLIMGEISLNKLGERVVKRSTVKDLKKAIDAAKEAGCSTITFIIDEADEATGERSIIRQCLQHARSTHGINVRVLLCSATAYHFKEIEGFERVVITDLDDDSTYCGTFVAGKKGARTPFVSQSIIDDALSLNGRLASFEIRGASGKSAAELEVIAETIEAFAGGFYLPLFGLHGKPMNGGRGMMLRFGNTSDSKHLKKLFEFRWRKQGIVCVDFHSNNYGKITVKDAIDARLAEVVREETINARYSEHDAPSAAEIGAPLSDEEKSRMEQLQYIVIVHGAGRRADRFPKHTTVFLDFTRDFSNSTAAEQGTMGRASGHGKISDKQSTIVLLSDTNFDLIEAMREFYDRFGKKGIFRTAGPNTLKLEDEHGNPITVKKKMVSRLIFDRRAWMHDDTMQSIFDDIERAYQPLMVWSAHTQTRTIREIDLPSYQAQGWTKIGAMENKPLKKGNVRVQGPELGSWKLSDLSTTATGFKKVVAMKKRGLLHDYLKPEVFARRNVAIGTDGKPRLAENRIRREVYFDLFGMLEADGRLDYVERTMREFYGDDKIELLRPMPNSIDPSETVPPEPATNEQKCDSHRHAKANSPEVRACELCLAAQSEYAERRKNMPAAKRYPKAVDGRGQFYQTVNGGLNMTFNNLERKSDGTRTYDDPSQRDRDRNYRHLFKPPMFFVQQGDPSQGEIARANLLVRFSLNTLRPFKAHSHRLGEAKGIEVTTGEQMALPRPDTAYWDFTSIEQQAQVYDQIEINQNRSKGRRRST